ncbi:hypothetical protein DICPUDRAFT_84579 [Dictyostelium purpureum]|uniref:DDE Tnp4 domain-containing protein n=1 Tax=Dictyostelium purpureum TaxID=5786 RepID=F1A334_DICPU|nr:uncharacterized protein DICPUDRAFT_84579 [Dictyostelium purpureum]EGC29395.1 hypothetical protein DICPUDRAFT_84579 [Dictyostelium purpureum]|eukprot:XP_003294082.1 hypothetical protein DICPUDRAFT_84579 [Dictyostelium purpureum]
MINVVILKLERSKIDLAPITSLVKAQDFALVNSLEEIIRTFQMKTTFLGCPYASTNSKRNAFTLFCQDISITICNVDHLENQTSAFDTIVADKGFRELKAFYNNMCVIEAGRKNTKYNKQQEKIQKSIRIIIENVFARIKRFSITSNT